MNSLVKNPLFSVITVCYNSGELIKKTIESVLSQDMSNNDVSFEYIIQDGQSTDSTLSIVNNYISSFNEKGIKLTINSAKDGGIYDAMNKAVKSATGKYVIFMNADDCFYSKTALSDVALSLKNNFAAAFSENVINANRLLPDIVFGDCIVKELGMYFKFRKSPDQIETRMPFSHQACFSKRELLLRWPLNLEYPITADYDFLLKCHMNKCSFFDSNVIISLVTANGVSSVNMFDAFSEACKVCDSYGIPRYSESEMKKKNCEMKIKQFVLDCFPRLVKKSIRKYQVTHRGQTCDVTLPEWAD